MSSLKNIQIKSLYKIKHFIEKTSFCEIYTGTDIETSKLVSISIYNASKIASILNHRIIASTNNSIRKIPFVGLVSFFLPNFLLNSIFNFYKLDTLLNAFFCCS